MIWTENYHLFNIEKPQDLRAENGTRVKDIEEGFKAPEYFHPRKYTRTGVDYSEFTIVASSGTFRSQEMVAALVQDLSKR